MIRTLCERLNHNIEIRQTLSQIRKEMKDSEKKELLLSWIQDGSLDLTPFLTKEDAITRKNTALLIGDSSLSSYLDVLFEAYEKEETLFVRESYLTAMKSMDASAYLPQLKERLCVLSGNEMSIENQKHLQKELRALTELILTLEKPSIHKFHAGDQTFHCIFRTNPLYPEATEKQMKGKTSSSRLGVRVSTNHLDTLRNIRTYHEILFQIPGMVSCGPTPESAAKTIADSSLISLLENTHDGACPFYFRLGVKNKMSLEQRSIFAKKIASSIEKYTNRKLINSTSHYEFEIRMIEGKSGSYHLLVKFYTFDDHRFNYRREYIPTSIKPVNAALLVELAKDYMIPDAQVLDPFCGVGTMLIERQKVVKGNTSYGIDHSPEAIEKAIINTNLADQIIHYINKDCFTFTHEYAFDEIFTEMPYATGQKNEADIYDTYKNFFPMARHVLTPEGTIIMYTRNREYVKRLCPKQNFQIIKEYKITEKPETWLMILR